MKKRTALLFDSVLCGTWDVLAKSKEKKKGFGI